MATLNYGISTLKLGAIAVDGDMGTSLTAIDGIVESSASLVTDDGEKTTIKTEESDTPVIQFNSPGETKVVFDAIDMTPASLSVLLGGTVSGTGDTATWSAPTSSVEIEKSLEIITKNNFKWEFPRVRVFARLNSPLSKKDIHKVSVTCVVLKPVKTGVAPIKLSKIQ